jgi:hypothetical protein
LRPGGAGQKLGQLVIGLGPDDEVYGGLATHDLLALGLGDAAGDGDGHGPQTGLGLFGFHLLQLPELGIDLLGRLLADVAGVQDDEVGALGRVGRGIAERAQHVGHALAVIDIHLAAVCLDEQTLRRRLSGHGFSVRADGRDEGVGH